MDDAAGVHAYDQVLAAAKEAHPGHSLEWYHAWILRAAAYTNGDMTNAPELPDE